MVTVGIRKPKPYHVVVRKVPHRNVLPTYATTAYTSQKTDVIMIHAISIPVKVADRA